MFCGVGGATLKCKVCIRLRLIIIQCHCKRESGIEEPGLIAAKTKKFSQSLQSKALPGDRGFKGVRKAGTLLFLIKTNK